MKPYLSSGFSMVNENEEVSDAEAFLYLCHAIVSSRLNVRPLMCVYTPDNTVCVFTVDGPPIELQWVHDRWVETVIDS